MLDAIKNAIIMLLAILVVGTILFVVGLVALLVLRSLIG